MGNYQPSDYTAALWQACAMHSERFAAAEVLELGCGSGELVRASIGWGAKKVIGSDIDAGAIQVAASALKSEMSAGKCDLIVGDLWQPYGGRTFDIIISNPPQFPALLPLAHDRPPSWSDGGPTGRRFIDAFINGLKHHLRDNGLAIMTHNAFISIKQTYQDLAAAGMRVETLLTRHTALSSEKMLALNPCVVESEAASIVSFSDSHIGCFQVLKIARA